MNAILFCNQLDLETSAIEFAQRFDFNFQGGYSDNAIEHFSTKNIPILDLTPQGLELHSSNMKPWKIDFLDATIQYRRSQSSAFKETLAKACGIKKNQEPLHVLDLTAGAGQDAFLLASLGCHVTMIERHPVVAALLEDALKRFRIHLDTYNQADSIHLSLHYDDAEHFLNHLSNESSPDIILIDPMHPERKKSASVKKTMQLFQQWIAPEEHPERLVDLSLQHAKKRVVLKWPRKATPLNYRKPDFMYGENTVRFEVYLPQLTILK